MTEIELKAWVDDPEAAVRRIRTFGSNEEEYDKADAYWLPAAAGGDRHSVLGSGVRVRRERRGLPGAEAVPDDAVVNFKRKEVRDGMEVNDEREFAISDASVFEELLQRIGFAVSVRKRKTGRSWKHDGMTMELSLVEGLGWFVELEILAEDDSTATVAAARRRLLDALARVGVPESRIENRYYTEMLRERDAY